MIFAGGIGGGSCGVSIGGAPSIARVERRSRRFHFAQMRFGPVPHAAKGLAQALAERGQAIFDLGRDDRVNLAMNQPVALHRAQRLSQRSEEHTSELQSLMRISYAVFCLKKKNKTDQSD